MLLCRCHTLLDMIRKRFHVHGERLVESVRAHLVALVILLVLGSVHGRNIARIVRGRLVAHTRVNLCVHVPGGGRAAMHLGVEAQEILS